jgi:hypothetical protein
MKPGLMRRYARAVKAGRLNRSGNHLKATPPRRYFERAPVKVLTWTSGIKNADKIFLKF